VGKKPVFMRLELGGEFSLLFDKGKAASFEKKNLSKEKGVKEGGYVHKGEEG